MSRKKLKELALRYKQALLHNRVPVVGIYLFGSYATGNTRPGSDIDFCVVSQAFGKDDFEEMLLLNRIAKRVAVEIEAFPVSEKDFKKKTNPFLVQALKTGRKIA